MKKVFNVVTDMHLGTLHETIADGEFSKSNLIYLGDNLDFKRMRKSDIPAAQETMKDFISRKKISVASNHEGEWGFPQFHIDQETKTLFHHGHLFTDKAEKYMRDTHTTWEGSNFFMWLATGIAGNLPRLKKFSAEDAKRAAGYAKIYNCTCSVSGHAHVSKIYDEMVDGIRVISLPCGLTTIELGE